MAIFSTAEAQASTIMKAEAITHNGTFQHWSFKVSDANGNVYMWEDTTENLGESSTPTDQQVSTYIKNYLDGTGSYSGVEKVTTSPIEVVASRRTQIIAVNPGSAPTVDDEITS